MMIGDDPFAPFLCAITMSAPDSSPYQHASNPLAPQHGPRPLPLFLAHLWRETENDPDLRRAALIGLRRYETAPRRPLPPHGEVHTRCGAAKLLHVGGAKKYPRRPVVMIPSLINQHHILDLSERASLARYLGECG